MDQAAGFAGTSEPVSAVAPTASHEDALQKIAHQLRQPLSSIESIAFYLSMVVPHKDEKIQEQLRQIRRLVEQSNQILTEGLNEDDGS